METGKHGITESLRCCDICSPVGSISPWDQGKKRHSGWSFTVLSWGCRKSSNETAALHYLPCRQSQITTFHKNSQERFVCWKWMPDISSCFGPMINSPLAFCICSLVEQKSKAICKDVSPEEQNNPLILGKINESADCWMHSSHNPLIQYPLDIFGLFFHVRLSQTHLWFARRQRLKGWISGHLRSVVTVFGILSWKPCWVQSLDPVIHQVLFLCKLSCQISFLSFWLLCMKGSKSCERLGRVHSTGSGTGPWCFAGGTSHADSVPSQASLAHDASHSFKSLKIQNQLESDFQTCPKLKHVETTPRHDAHHEPVHWYVWQRNLAFTSRPGTSADHCCLCRWEACSCPMLSNTAFHNGFDGFVCACLHYVCSCHFCIA